MEFVCIDLVLVNVSSHVSKAQRETYEFIFSDKSSISLLSRAKMNRSNLFASNQITRRRKIKAGP